MGPHSHLNRGRTRMWAVGFAPHLITGGSHWRFWNRILTPSETGASGRLRKQQAQANWKREAGGRKGRGIWAGVTRDREGADGVLDERHTPKTAPNTPAV